MKLADPSVSSLGANLDATEKGVPILGGGGICGPIPLTMILGPLSTLFIAVNLASRSAFLYSAALMAKRAAISDAVGSGL